MAVLLNLMGKPRDVSTEEEINLGNSVSNVFASLLYALADVIHDLVIYLEMPNVD